MPAARSCLASRGELHAALEDARKELVASFQTLPSRDFMKPLPGGWSVKDTLAHVAMWDEMELLELRRVARGHRSAFEGSFDYSLIDRWNEVQFALRKRFSLKQVMDDLREARRELIAFLDSIDDRHLTAPFIRTACGVQAQHDRDHAEQIRAWRGGQEALGAHRE